MNQAKNKRQNQVTEKRNLPTGGNASPSVKSNKPNNRRKDGKKGKKKGAKKVKAPPTTKVDLDTDMDSYWHAAGKGPDPKIVSLDREMEEYRKGAATTAATATA